MAAFDFAKVKDPIFFKENVLNAHASFRTYASREEYRTGSSSLALKLDGIWKFAYAKNYTSAIPGFEKTDYDCSGWDDIHVPAHIQMEGYDIPPYANVQYPWDGREDVKLGEIPQRFNPVASYVKYFELQESMQGKPVHIEFEGVESGMALWLNGSYVGYTEDSFSAHAFDLTPYLQPSVNKLAVQVFKWTSSSWCEDQDFFRFSGIFRSVWLYAIPTVYLEDVSVKTLFAGDDFTHSTLEVALQVEGKGAARLTLRRSELEVFSEKIALNGGSALFRHAVENPHLWSAEDPALYIDNSGFEVWNKNLFTSTGAFDCVALLHRDGKLYQQQELTNIDVAPEERSSFPLPFMVPALPGEYAVTISFRLKEDTSWAKKGHEVAFGQGVIAVVRSIPSKKVTPFTVTHSTHNIGVRGENFDVLFSDLNGGLTSYRYAGKEMIQEIPRPNFWRAPTDNDCGNNMGGVRGQWKLASLYATAKGIGKEIPSVHGGTILQNPTCEVEADSVVVTYLYNLQTSPAAECSLQYRVFGDGRIQTTLHYDPVEGLAAMPEFGVLFKIDADYDTVEWFGNGPAETYWDRQHGAKLGIYQNKVADNMAQYLVPQECGAKTAVRWAKVVDRKGRGLLLTADAPCYISKRNI